MGGGGACAPVLPSSYDDATDYSADQRATYLHILKHKPGEIIKIESIISDFINLHKMRLP